MSFSFDVTTDLSGSGSYQGQLSSSYTNALSSYLQTDGADYVAFLAYVANELSVETALELKAEIEAGNFSLSGLFSAAQSKTGEVDADAITNPQPTLTVTVGETTYTIDLTAMLTGTDTATWISGTAKSTAYHTREFFTDSQEPADYDPHWADSSEPVNKAPSPASFEEVINEFDIKAGAPVDGDNLFEINLLSGAVDPEDDELSVVEGTVVVKLNGNVVSSDAFSIDGNTLVIDTNSDYFDTLFKDQKWTFEVTYDITDGEHVVASAGTVEVTGTADQFTGTQAATFTPTGTVGSNSSDWDGSFSFVIVAPDEAFDINYAGTAKVTVTGDIDNNHNHSDKDEKIVIQIEGESLTFGMLKNDDNQEPGSPGYIASVQTVYSSYSSTDSTINVAYDSTTSSGANGVDQIESINVEVTYTYWA